MANVESTASVQDTFSVALLGDAAYPVTFLNNDEPATAGNMFKATTTDAELTNDDFIWSPRSTSTAASVEDFDWTNGYGVIGLPATQMNAEYFNSTY